LSQVSNLHLFFSTHSRLGFLFSVNLFLVTTLAFLFACLLRVQLFPPPGASPLFSVFGFFPGVHSEVNAGFLWRACGVFGKSVESFFPRCSARFFGASVHFLPGHSNSSSWNFPCFGGNPPPTRLSPCKTHPPTPLIPFGLGLFFRGSSCPFPQYGITSTLSSLPNNAFPRSASDPPSRTAVCFRGFFLFFIAHSPFISAILIRLPIDRVQPAISIVALLQNIFFFYPWQSVSFPGFNSFFFHGLLSFFSFGISSLSQKK